MRAVSDEFKAAAFAQETSECIASCVEITHDDLAEPIRVNSTGEEIERNGDTYVAFPYELILPPDAEGFSPARLRIDNTDRQIVQAVRSINSAATVGMAVIRASEPDVTEAEYNDFKLTNVTFDVGVVEGEVSVENFTGEPFTAGTMNPGDFPGLH